MPDLRKPINGMLMVIRQPVPRFRQTRLTIRPDYLPADSESDDAHIVENEEPLALKDKRQIAAALTLIFETIGNLPFDDVRLLRAVLAA
ncbi:hypothetical protein FRB94_013652 [Tulasnella sp. JGI-2019a]|nr:hypothetical protein FRB94_013652 [Tulasnella sp. JGI-2019a]